MIKITLYIFIVLCFLHCLFGLNTSIFYQGIVGKSILYLTVDLLISIETVLMTSISTKYEREIENYCDISCHIKTFTNFAKKNCVMPYCIPWHNHIYVQICCVILFRFLLLLYSYIHLFEYTFFYCISILRYADNVKYVYVCILFL